MSSPPQGTWRNPFGEGALNNLIFFQIGMDENATFNCAAVGSRCSFLRNDWRDIDDDGGGIADQTGGAVWTVAQNTSFPLDTLNLNDCQFSTCVPACFSDCNCTTGGESCPETSAPPTASPTPAPETSDVKNCELKRNEGKCSQVAIRDFVFAGADCYCYNFCDGEFLSCCEENGDCGTTECEGEEVFGCPELVDEPQTPNSAPNGNGDPNGDSSGTVISTQTHMLAVVAAAMFLAWDWN